MKKDSCSCRNISFKVMLVTFLVLFMHNLQPAQSSTFSFTEFKNITNNSVENYPANDSQWNLNSLWDYIPPKFSQITKIYINEYIT